MGEQSQLLLKPTEVELGLQVGVEFDKNSGPLTLLPVDRMNGDRGCNIDARANVKLSLIIGVAR